MLLRGAQERRQPTLYNLGRTTVSQASCGRLKAPADIKKYDGSLIASMVNAEKIGLDGFRGEIPSRARSSEWVQRSRVRPIKTRSAQRKVIQACSRTPLARPQRRGRNGATRQIQGLQTLLKFSAFCMGQAFLFFPFGILLQGWQPQLKTPLLRSGAAKSSKMTKERKTVRSLLAFFASASLSFLVVWSIEKLGAIAAEYSPFYGIEKGAVLQEARIFNDSHVDARRCQQVEPHSSLQMDSSAYNILSDEAMSSYEPS